MQARPQIRVILIGLSIYIVVESPYINLADNEGIFVPVIILITDRITDLLIDIIAN